jgi:hypothetical protein
VQEDGIFYDDEFTHELTGLREEEAPCPAFSSEAPCPAFSSEAPCPAFSSMATACVSQLPCSRLTISTETLEMMPVHRSDIDEGLGRDEGNPGRMLEALKQLKRVQ